MMYLYAITGRGTALPTGPGIAGAPLRCVDADGLRAVCAALTVRPRPERAVLWQHEHVVEAVMARGSVLPVRFGTALADEDAVRALLAGHRAALREALGAVAGRVEMGARVLTSEPGEQSADGGADRRPERGRASSGREYLLARQAAARAAASLRACADRRAGRLHEALAQGAAKATLRVLPATGTLMAGAYLVDATAQGSFRARAARLSAAELDLRVVPTGPWPPYSFAPTLGKEPVDAG